VCSSKTGHPTILIGGTEARARNTISGNDDVGVRITSTAGTGNTVQGNYIGTNAAVDTKLANGDDGVSIQDGAVNNTVGVVTDKSNPRNVISGNGGDGVEILSSSSGTTGNRILSNSIYENDALGINLVHFNNLTEGLTPNDGAPLDPDVGPNNLQNFPVIESARLTTRRIGGHRRKVTIIKGALNSNANTTFTLQFFGSPEADPSGFGEGKTYLGQKSGVTTNDSCDATFTFKTKKRVPKGQFVTATAIVTATDPAIDQSNGDTSEFSDALQVS
jgi:hypothetical protein